MRSWDMVARYVVPEIDGYLAGLGSHRTSSPTTAPCSSARAKRSWPRSDENEAAVAALAVTHSPMLSASASNVPDLHEYAGR